VRVCDWTLKKTVVLVGMMGAGKTAIGTAVARDARRALPRFRRRDRARRQHVDPRDLRARRRTLLPRQGDPGHPPPPAHPALRPVHGAAAPTCPTGTAASSTTPGIAVWLNADLPISSGRGSGTRTRRPLLRTARSPRHAQGALRGPRSVLRARRHSRSRRGPSTPSTTWRRRSSPRCSRGPDVLEITRRMTDTRQG
jgi:shikimate kinase